MAKPTITDLAKRVGVSVCTVNKALSGKPKVSDKTRQRILAEAERLGYRPNRMAQGLARNPIRLAYVHADNYPSFFGRFEEGVREGVDRLVDQRVPTTLHALDPEDWENRLLATVYAILQDGLSGLILSPVSGMDYRQVWDVLAEHRVPLVQLGLEVTDSPAVLTVRQDTLLSGQIAAELLAHFDGPVAVMIGNRRVVDHDEKLRGFQAVAEQQGLTIATVCEHEDDPELAYSMTQALLSEHPDLRGVYVATDNFSGIARALAQHKPAGRIKVVATGVFPEVQAAMAAGLIHYSLDQRMAEQGALAVQQLHELLCQHPLPSTKILVPPRIAVRANIESLAANGDSV